MTTINYEETKNDSSFSRIVLNNGQEINMDDLLHVIRPGSAGNGARQIVLPIYNTQVDIKAYPGSHELSVDQLNEALLAVRDVAIEFEMNLSRTRPTSEITRLNDAHGEPVHLSESTIDLIDRSRSYCEASGGVFDVTMGSVTPLWNFYEETIPSRDDLDTALTHVDWRMIEVDRDAQTVRLADPEARIDLGGIAKGYIADALAAVLVEHGCDCAFINLGGNVLTVGARQDGHPWRVGVRDPKRPDSLRAVVPVIGKSVVTSGLYERNFTKDGVFYHHILSPRDGMPVATDVGGSTIVSDRSLDGDGYSTTLFALGVEAALAFIEERPGLEALIIDTNDQVHTTSGLAESVQIIGQTLA